MRQKHTIGVVGLNLQHASRIRVEQQVKWLTRQDLGEVLVLSEVAGGDRCAHLVEVLRSTGFTPVYCGAAQRGNQVVLAFRHGAIDEILEVGRCSARFVHIAVTVDSVGMEIVGLYVPSRGPAEQRNVAKRAFQRDVTAAMPSIAAEAQRHGRHLLVAGDLNVLEPGHVPHHRVFGKWEYDFYKSFLHAGRLRDAFREHNGTEIDHSWFGRRSGLGYRFDHLFCSTGVEIITCHYDHKPRQTGLSDHSALTAQLRLPPHTLARSQSVAPR